MDTGQKKNAPLCYRSSSRIFQINFYAFHIIAPNLNSFDTYVGRWIGDSFVMTRQMWVKDKSDSP